MTEYLEPLLAKWKLSVNEPLTMLIISASILVLSILLFIIIHGVLKNIAKRRPDSLVRIGWKKLKRPVLVLILLIDFIILEAVFSPGSKPDSFVPHFTAVGLIICITWLIIRLINFSREIILRNYNNN